ncbi:MAG: ECF transporter S component [candidate division Zixibacteria bacterium]|nr:ECF transporter S component [candidate division Zixibacteria bacterium]
MTGRTRLITRVALFSALIYVLSWATSVLPNINFAFFIAFTAGLVWGGIPGLLVGGIGMWLWTWFNPWGPAALPVALAQVGGMALCGLIGRLYRPERTWTYVGVSAVLWFALAGFLCSLSFYVPVAVVDAWVHRPFWPRLIGGLSFSAVSVVANMVIFPLLFGVTRRLYLRETATL